MTHHERLPAEFTEWVVRLLDGSITDEQFAQLDRELEHNDAALTHYLELLTAHAGLMDLGQASPLPAALLDTEMLLSPEDLFDSLKRTSPRARESVPMPLAPADSEEQRKRRIEEYARRQLEAFLEEQQAGLARPLPPRATPSLAEIADCVARASLTICHAGLRAAKWTAVCLLPVTFVVFLTLWTCSRRTVANLADSMDAKWSVDIAPGAPLHKGQFKLQRGYARIVFQKGADVLIEAPAEFRLRSGQRMTLDSGQLSAEVPPSARGFRVDTTQASIVDLGTQFGVRADSDQTSDLHVFKGQASLTPRATGAAVAGQILTEGQAKRVDAAGQVHDIPIDRIAFVRRFFGKSGFTWRGQPIDLADVVGGGNGFGTGQLNRWLEINTGLDGTRFIVNERMTQVNQTTDNRYHRVAHLPYVDGVFSPDADAGPVQVSSQGHVWRDCPKTCGMFFEDIFNGDYISFGIDSHGFVLKGQAYGTREHPGIALHSNAGITFDLEAMRTDMPGLEITEFKARCGISQDVRTHLDGDTQRGIADFWVLVDGKKRFEAVGMDVNSEPPEISVPLSRQERFVTLVTTDGNGRANFDWGFFAEPRLEVRIVQ
jgi:hypothetical protein